MTIKKFFLITFIFATVIVIIGFLFLKKGDRITGLDQLVYKNSLSVSKEYTLLRYRTENVLEKAKEYGDYDKWNNEMSAVIDGWKALEGKVVELEKDADKLANEKTTLNLVKDVYAYNSVEIQKVIESAPAGKTVRTLAKHLGVDVKMAHLILNQTQDQITREAYGEEGDVFETCEQNSMRIKNGAKVTVFVGGVVLTGGMAGVATSGVVAKTALVVSGADLVLEVADDEAKIALGDKNKVSEMVGKVRTVTEPAASILTLINIPGNVSKAMEKISAVSFVGDQIRSVAQDEKVLGISIKVDEKGEVKTQVSGLTETELVEWKKNNNVTTVEPIEEIIKQIEEAEKPIEAPKQEDKKETPKTNSGNNSAQVYKIVNVSNESYMMDVCHNPTCWDDLAANEAEDRDVGGIYTMGKVYGPGESFKHGFRPSDNIKTSERVEMLADSYRITAYFAIAPFEGPKNKTIEYGTWQNHSVEIKANYGDEPVIEWDGNSLKQVK
ncbi:MAG: hypothetical protein PHX84_03730 [Candidatus Shapirobacteria bacterium]|nr:hypothetical protein [Candidatus Shapirobacteria bacterium]